MLVGHFAVGLTAKRIAPAISLGTLVLAAMLADLLWSLFTIAGIEHVEFRPAMGAGNYFQACNIVWSHNLLMDAVWGALLAAAYFLRRRAARGAWIVFAAVVRSLGSRLDRSPPRHAAGAGRPHTFRTGTLVFHPGHHSRRGRILAGGGNPLRPRLPAQKTRRDLRVLDGGCASHARLVRQHFRPAAPRSSLRALCQPDSLLFGGSLGVLDESPSPGRFRLKSFHPFIDRL